MNAKADNACAPQDERGYIGWFNRRSVWLKVFLFPFLLVALCIEAALVAVFWVPIVVLCAIPVVVAKGVREHRFWKQLPSDRRLVEWSEIVPKVETGAGTLIVEIGFDGKPAVGWWITQSRNAIDSMRRAWSWQRFEPKFDLFNEDPADEECMETWATQCLHPLAHRAKAIHPESLMMANLSAEAKQESVLVMSIHSKGCISVVVRANRYSRFDA